MRLWTLSPTVLDRRALVACWREALLAQKVLAGKTKGYAHHPQLERFRAAGDPHCAIGHYLGGLRDEADRRGYHFDGSKIEHWGNARTDGRPRQLWESIPATTGQMHYELALLKSKVQQRDPQWFSAVLADLPEAPAHPLFTVCEGPIAAWEKVKDL